ncbi:radical SAM protein [Clostridium sp. D2Q-11]|uniref:Radical SAM protein n=1 Tax=Anaeromonas frigoriresistens TaxID=2683708 RepID=A0A942Z8G2_9FIRM|nr:radical SAM protein [Anaeromonas frigoriresistens]MBS4539767.1 radical SAM protein [Anaeromonas frigoriresistens]
MAKKHYIIPVFIPHQGCPHDCVFCNQRKITGLDTDMTEKEVVDIIENNLSTMKESSIKEIAFFGGSFTGLDINIQKSFLSIAKKYKDLGKIDKIRLSTRPDYINKELIEILKDYNVDIIELGVQSMDEEVLIRSNRGHSIQDVYKAVELIKDQDFILGLQMMVGLVGDTRLKSMYTAKEFIELKPDFVRIYPTLVVKETYLETLYKNGLYNPLTLDQTINYVKDILMLFEYNNITVIRIGLQPTDNISFDKDIVTGPFHPAIRQIIESKIYGDILDMFFSKTNFKSDSLNITLNNKEISNFVGYKGENLEKLKLHFRIKVNGNNLTEDIIISDGVNKYKLDKEYFIKEYLFKHNLI